KPARKTRIVPRTCAVRWQLFQHWSEPAVAFNIELRPRVQDHAHALCTCSCSHRRGRNPRLNGYLLQPPQAEASIPRRASAIPHRGSRGSRHLTGATARADSSGSVLLMTGIKFKQLTQL